MERLTFEGDFCDIAMCLETRGGSFCEDGACSQRRVWERLKAYEDTGLTPEEIKALQTAFRGIEAGEYIKLPLVAMVEQSLQGGKMTPQRDQLFNGRYAVVYMDRSRWKSPLIDICGKPYNREEAEARMAELAAPSTREEAEAALAADKKEANQ